MNKVPFARKKVVSRSRWWTGAELAGAKKRSSGNKKRIRAQRLPACLGVIDSWWQLEQTLVTLSASTGAL